jgi:hypothetical protein
MLERGSQQGFLLICLVLILLVTRDTRVIRRFNIEGRSGLEPRDLTERSSGKISRLTCATPPFADELQTREVCCSFDQAGHFGMDRDDVDPDTGGFERFGHNGPDGCDDHIIRKCVADLHIDSLLTRDLEKMIELNG